MLKRIKEESDTDTPGLRTLCPTRWTVCASSLLSILSNYESLLELWKTAVKKTTDTDMKIRIQGVNANMQSNKFLFALHLSELIFRHTDKLSQTLQQPKLSNVEGREIAVLVVATLRNLRSDESFDIFWEKLETSRISLGLQESDLPRKRKTPARYQVGIGDTYFPISVKDEYRRQYFEAIDLAVSCIEDRFNQEGFKMLCNVEQLILKACAGDDITQLACIVCTFFKDFNKNDLLVQLSMCHQLYKSYTTDPPSIETIKASLLSLSESQRSLIDEVCKLLQLLIVMPATNASSERSFSALRRVKSYLRSTMGQARLNHLMVLHYHSDRTDNLDLKGILNEYVDKNDRRRSTFAKF